MLPSLRRVGLALFVGLASVLVLVSQTSAQTNGTLVVYVEAQGGDKNFSFSGSPSALGSFQIPTEDGGGAKVFELPAGNYTLHQNLFFDGWVPQDTFAAGTGNWSTVPLQNPDVDFSFTVSSEADVYYYRVTMRNSIIPESLGLPMLLAVAVVVSSIVLLFHKKKRTTAPALAVLFSVLMIFAFVAQVEANPDRDIQLGTRGNDDQIQFGTPNKDVIVQLGHGGNDTQYAEGAAGDDWIIQNGGSGNDDFTAIGGSGNDHIVQDGGEGNDVAFASTQAGGTDYFGVITVDSGSGNDDVTVYWAQQMTVRSGDGNDTLWISNSPQNDTVIIDAGAGDDSARYDVTGGRDDIRVDGGSGNDYLTINKNQQNFQLVNSTGLALYSVGSDGIKITIISIEHGQVIGDDGKVAFQW
jgi:Ca2+-binding RTX toxin-like protein